jgi:hypothetical protein
MHLIKELRKAWDDARATMARGEQLSTTSVATPNELLKHFLKRRFKRYSTVLFQADLCARRFSLMSLTSGTSCATTWRHSIPT